MFEVLAAGGELFWGFPVGLFFVGVERGFGDLPYGDCSFGKLISFGISRAITSSTGATCVSASRLRVGSKLGVGVRVCDGFEICDGVCAAGTIVSTGDNSMGLSLVSAIESFVVFPISPDGSSMGSCAAS